MKNMKVRIPMYFVGLFIMTIGIALSVKSNLGVSPVSSIPYTMTCVWGIEMGKATIIFHAALVLIQIIILLKEFQTDKSPSDSGWSSIWILHDILQLPGYISAEH